MKQLILYCVESATPCCHATVRLMAHGPKEEYYRRCAQCGQRWLVKRAGMVIQDGTLAGANADAIGWTKVERAPPAAAGVRGDEE